MGSQVVAPVDGMSWADVSELQEVQMSSEACADLSSVVGKYHSVAIRAEPKLNHNVHVNVHVPSVHANINCTARR